MPSRTKWRDQLFQSELQQAAVTMTWICVWEEWVDIRNQGLGQEDSRQFGRFFGQSFGQSTVFGRICVKRPESDHDDL